MIVIAAISWMASGRIRCFAILGVWIFLLFVSRINGQYSLKDIFSIRYLVPIGIILFLIGWDQIQVYYGNDVSTARNILFNSGLKIMRDFFPLGTGFGTFGTEVAANHYSPLYYTYNVNRHWALVEGGSELTDCYWPAMGAELGFLGLLFMALLVYNFIKLYLNIPNENKNKKISVSVYCIYLIVSSLGSGIFNSYLTADFAIILSAILSYNPTQETIQNGANASNNNAIIQPVQGVV